MMRPSTDLLAPVAATDLPVLVIGERGAGHEQLARQLHQLGPGDGPFVIVDANQVSDVRKLLERAVGGTLYLRDIENLPAAEQAGLLQLVEGGGPVPRLVTSTSNNLQRSMEEGELLSDLFYRLSAIKLHLQPLRDRREELPRLLEEHIRNAAEALGRPVPSLPSDAMEELISHAWPGNLTELAEVATRIIESPEAPGAESIRVLLECGTTSPTEATRLRTLAEIVDDAISSAVAQSNGDVKRAAGALGVSRATVYRRTRPSRGDEDGGA